MRWSAVLLVEAMRLVAPNLNSAQKWSQIPQRHPAAAVKHTTRALSGPPSTGAAIAMDGGVADTACYYTGR
jgi:hypothetical protein